MSTSRHVIPTETLTATFIVRIKHKFRQRITEWSGTAVMMGLGWILLQEGDSFSLSPSFDTLKGIMSENDWGGALLIAGITRFIALWINGSMEAVTPWFRVAGAVIGFIFFALIFASMVIAALLVDMPWSTGLIMYGAAAGQEIAAMYLAVIDARIYENGRRRSSRTAGLR